jgi:spore coat protein CotF
VRHQQEEILSYNEIVACTRGNSRFNPIPPNTAIQGITNQQIQYGVNRPLQFAPQSDALLSDEEIAMSILWWHKSGARNCLNATLECADPNVRRLMLNCAATCSNQAYEVFLFMNQQGLYQVPTLQNRTAETFLQSYQPASDSLVAQYGVQVGQTGNNANLSVGSVESVIYGR